MLNSDTSWATSPAVRRVMQGNTSRDTKPEIAVRSAVHALGCAIAFRLLAWMPRASCAAQDKRELLDNKDSRQQESG
jgi:hypothetical protein